MAQMMQQDDKRVVLLCVDGSDIADHAFSWYLENMHQPRDYVYGVIVPEYNLSGISVISMVGPLSDVNAISSEFNSQHQIVEKLCSDYTAKLRSKNCKGQVDPYSGDKPGIIICEQALKLGADCIIMGTRGLSKLQKVFMGSVSNFVLHHAHCAVTVVPARKCD